MLTIPKLSDTLFQKLIEIRAHLHAYPELSFEEYKTAAFIENKLEEIGVSDIQRIGKTGVTAMIYGRNPEKKCVALRADIDALPITETNDVPYKSQHQGIMHACGHDVHTTCLLGAAELLIQHKDHFEGSIKLIFQPGEEKSPGGASILIKEGVLQNPKVSAIAGLHVSPELKSGTVGFRIGPYMASADELHITLIGKSGHAALPHKAIDPISMAAQLIIALQQVINRSNDPFNPSVLSFGMIEGGYTTNVIPSEVKIKGTFRTFNEGWRQEALTLIDKVCQSITMQYGGSYILNIPPGYPCLNNDERTTRSIAQQAETLLGVENIVWLPLRSTSEDFSFYTQHIPGCFFRLGTNLSGKKYTSSVHSSTFDVHPESIKVGTLMMANAGIALLAAN